MDLFNFIGTSNSSITSFQCPHCGKRTQHTKITLAEFCAINPDMGGKGMKYLGAALDVFQITRIANIAGISHWKCCNCGLTTIRKSNGEVDTIGQRGK